ncbi:uncharacterized protein LOC132936657 isoform X2 [Metopolophium dirhodum]|nr:uncharacterized protein LOC132936657 isoform X2 [Metopolophium dirhodum]XP_060859397.1 uncharacterized protein LOC132936657 isoform X2 [Metopolophium dirhodum]XP_060859399.1 uncharacterized protein LOC132936657 isoform X2 [Metopolophium dirhodum]XP_060859400.1 uncharacterized protein LOC132936657 isoform X2 [Metopolophium dirhodum]XP_060859401.1 uncharacterized protein LOC132936657 isoform X2 [Metopolophium dirhodum]XP_060859402.1 uncharacterized protein LOC132936657 isoform X2 [Metopolophi
MNVNTLTDLCEIMHGLGERMPRRDTVEIIHSVIIKQMILLIYQIQKAANLLNHQNISIKHVLYVLKNHKVTLIRILSYYWLKDNILQLNKLSDTDEKKGKNKKSKLELIDKDIIENITNLEDVSIQIDDPATALAKIDFTTKDLSPDNTKVKSVFKKLRNAIVDLKLQINITEEEVRKSNEIRLIRANDVSIILTANAYEGFEVCRRKNFHKNKIGERLLLQVHKALPWDITYNNQVKEVLLFLAKETISCVIDRVFENRKCTDSCDENNSTIIKKKKYGSILVDEITSVIKSTWKTPFEEIRYPYDEEDAFFNNQLIFEL